MTELPRKSFSFYYLLLVCFFMNFTLRNEKEIVSNQKFQGLNLPVEVKGQQQQAQQAPAVRH